MGSSLKRVLLSAQRHIEDILTYVSAAAVAAMMVITIADVIVRYLTPTNVPGSYEYVSLLFVLVIYLGLAYAQRENSHIAIDALYSRLPRRYRKLLQLFQLGTFLIFAAALTWYTAAVTWDNYVFGDTILGAISVVTWPSRLTISIGFLFLSFRFLIQLLNLIILDKLIEEEAPTTLVEEILIDPITPILIIAGVAALLALRVPVGFTLLFMGAIGFGIQPRPRLNPEHAWRAPLRYRFGLLVECRTAVPADGPHGHRVQGDGRHVRRRARMGRAFERQSGAGNNLCRHRICRMLGLDDVHDRGLRSGRSTGNAQEQHRSSARRGLHRNRGHARRHDPSQRRSDRLRHHRAGVHPAALYRRLLSPDFSPPSVSP